VEEWKLALMKRTFSLNRVLKLAASINRSSVSKDSKLMLERLEIEG
jgi:hypothetical protein